MKRTPLILYSILLCLPLPAQTIDLSLKQCLELSRENDPYLQNSRLEIKAAQEQVREARWSFYPQLSLQGFGYYAVNPLLKISVNDVLGTGDNAYNISSQISTYARSLGINDYYSTFQRGYAFAASAMQPIYAGGRIVNGNKLADLGVEASRLQSAIRQKETVENVEAKYWQVVSLQEKRKTLDMALSMLDTLYMEVSAAAEAGLVLRSDLDKVALKQKELRSADVKLHSGTKLAKMDLFNAIGMTYSILKLDQYNFCETLDNLPSPSEVEIPEGEIETFEESRLLELKVEAGELEKKMSVGEYLPQVAAGLGYGYGNMQGRSSGQFNGLGMISVQIPITDIGKAVRRGRRYDYKIQEARNEQAYLDSQLLLQLRMLQVEMETSWDQLELARQYSIDAEKSFRRTKADFEAGRVPVSELLQSRLDYQSACEDLIGRKMDYRIAMQKYLHRCGK